jgi:four helix bundle suffix protein
MAVTKTSSPFRKLVSCMTARCGFANASWKSATVPATKWCRLPAPAKQNILEGSRASGTSKETELRLTNVARASLEELLEDYRDFTRLRGIEEWTKEHSHTRRLRQLNRQPSADYETFRKAIEHPDPAIAANVMIGLIKLTNYLLDQQLRQLEEAFVKEGGLRERMTHARLVERAKHKHR